MSQQAVLELREAIERQKEVKATTYGGKVAVPCVGNTDGNSAILQVKIPGDAHFKFDRLTMKALGPTDINGRVLNAAPATQTGFPMGIALPVTGVLLACAGLQVRITNSSRNLEYTQGFIDVASFATPGYGSILYEAFKLKGVAAMNETISFEFQNLDNAKALGGANAYHFVTVALHGERYEGVALPDMF
jgi:hypothetical protein